MRRYATVDRDAFAIQTLFLTAAHWGHSVDCKARSCHAGRRAYTAGWEHEELGGSTLFTTLDGHVFLGTK